MKKIYIIGKNYENNGGGPSNIIRGLLSGLKRQNIPVQDICLSENFGKCSLVIKLFGIFFKERNCIINVHTDGLKLPKLVYWFSRIDKKNTYFLTVHGIYSVESKFSNTYKKKYAKIERKLFKNFPNIICVSELLKERIITDFNREKPIYVVQNGIEDLEFKAKDFKFTQPLRFIMLGGVRARKGILESLDVLTYLNEKGIKANLDIYGAVENDEIFKQFNEKIRLFNLGEQVNYKGYINVKKTIYEAVHEADLQLCLSKWDTFNVAVLESLVLCTPCVATINCGAKSAITENVNGIVVDLNKEDYKENILNYVLVLLRNSYETFNKIEYLANIINKNYCWDNIVKYYLQIIQ